MSIKIKHLILVIALLFVNVILLSAYSIDVDVEVWVPNMVCDGWEDEESGDWECDENGENCSEVGSGGNSTCSSYSDQGSYETETISVDVPDGTPPEDIKEILDQIAEDSDLINDIGLAEEQPEQLGTDLQNAGDTITLDNLINNSDQIAGALIEDLTIAHNADDSVEGGDPVRLALGDFITKNIDASYQYLNNKIEIVRTYVSNNNSDHSFGKGWFFNYDTRIIHGVKPNSVEIADQAEIEAGEARIIYEGSLARYNKSMNDLIAIVGSDDGAVVGIAYEWKQELEITISALQTALNGSQASQYSEVRIVLNAHLSKAQDALNNHIIPVINRAEAAKTALKASWATVENIRIVKENLEALAEQLRKESDMALSNEARNQYVMNNTDPSYLEMTGNTTISLIDENGIPHTYNIIAEPDYDSGVYYADGSINYYPLGADTISRLPNDNELYIKSDGSYIITRKDKIEYYYSFYGQLEKTIDTNGNIIEFSYDMNNLLTKISDTLGRETILDRENDRISTITDPKGRIWQYSYNTQGLLESVIDAEGDQIRYLYAGLLITDIIKPDGSSRKYAYTELNGRSVVDNTTDEEGNTEYFRYYPELGYTEYTNASGIFERHYYNERNLETKVEYADGSYVSMEYDDDNNLIKQIDQLGHVYLYSYDDNRNLTEAIDPAGNIEKWGYNDFNKISTYMDKLGSTTYYSYDINSNLVSVEYPDYTTVYYSYNSSGQVTEFTDQSGSHTYYDYNDFGYLSSKEDQEDNTEYFEKDIIGNIVEYTDPQGYSTLYDYNNDNKVILITDSMGYTESFEYDNRKDLIAVTDRNGNTTTNEYDDRHLLLKTINPLDEITEYQYRADGKMISKSIEGINNITYEYDLRGNLVKETQVETGVSKSYEYNRLGHVTAITDPNSNRTTYGYNNIGLLSWIKDPLGNESFINYYANGQVYSATDKLGNKTYYYYDNMNRVTSIVDPYYNNIKYEYDNRGNLTSFTDKNGNETEYDYDKNNRLIEETDALGNSLGFEYDSRDLLLSVTNKNSNTTYYEYDSLGRILRTIDSLSGTKEFSYDPSGNMVANTDKNNNTTTFNYDELNRVINKIDPYGNSSLFTYNYLGNLISVTDALGNVKSFEYDELGRLIKDTDALGAFKTYEYDKNGNLIAFKDELERPAYYAYDSLNRLISKTNALNETISYEYDANNNLIAETDASDNTYSYEYDKLNRLLEEINRLGDEQVYTYDAGSNLISKTDFNGDLTEYAYDPNNRLIQTEFSDNTEKLFSYDPEGNILTAENSTGKLGYEYNELNRLVKSTDFATGEIIEYEYDPAGNRTNIILPESGRDTEYIYGNINELLSVTDTEGKTISFEYDQLGREIKKYSPNDIVTEIIYDPAGRITSILNENIEKGPGINKKLISLSYVYNDAGEVIYQLDDEGNITNYEYDEIGRLKNAYYPFTSDKKESDFKERLNLGLFPEYEKTNGKGNNRQEASFMIPEVSIPGFNNGFFKSSLMEVLRDNEELFKLYNHLDNNGKWNVEIEEGATDFVTNLAIPYDMMDAVEDVFSLIGNKNTNLNINQWMWIESFEYDENSNRISKANGWGSIAYTYNEENQILTAGNRAYEHDLNGNLTTESISVVEAIYTYNPENRVIDIYSEVTGFIGNGEWKLEAGIEYTYDPFRRRNSSIEYTEYVKNNGNHEKEWTTETNVAFIYDGLSFNIISEVTDIDYSKPGNGNGNQGNNSQHSPVTEYIYGNGSIVSRTDFTKHGNSNHQDKVYYEQDILGSTILQTNDKGHAVEIYSYDAYGVMYDGDFDRNSDYGYNEKRLAAPTGFYNYGFRDYAPNIGRWTTVDPIRSGDNWYVYVGNDPVNFIDKWGFDAGDLFLNPDKAAIDFAYTYNDDSIRENVEYGSTIFSIEGDEGDKVYSYTIPNKSDDEGSVNPSRPLGDDWILEGVVHSHSDYPEEMKNNEDAQLISQEGLITASTKDQAIAKDLGVPIYTVGPAGTVDKWDPEKNETTSLWQGNFIDTNAPKSPSDRLNPDNWNWVDVMGGINNPDHTVDPYNQGILDNLLQDNHGLNRGSNNVKETN